MAAPQGKWSPVTEMTESVVATARTRALSYDWLIGEDCMTTMRKVFNIASAIDREKH